MIVKDNLTWPITNISINHSEVKIRTSRWYEAWENVHKPSHYQTMNFDTLFLFDLQEKVELTCIRLKTSDRQVSNNIYLVCDYIYHQRAINHENRTSTL